MSSREDRIMSLASTLKASGLAKSEAQARMMAEEMIGVEENVQKTYEEEHTKAHEYLKTAKNLGTPRFKEQPKNVEQKPKIEPIGTRIQPISTSKESESRAEIDSSKNTLLKSVDESAHDKKVELGPVHTDVDFGKGTLKDMMLNQIKAENHEIKTIEQLEEEAENRKAQEQIEETVEEKVDEPKNESKDESKAESKDASEESASDVSESTDDSAEESNEEASSEDSPKLDGDKLREMMEEDGPMEEHTREITSKPEVVKPKEDYVENTVDLSDMFNVNKK